MCDNEYHERLKKFNEEYAKIRDYFVSEHVRLENEIRKTYSIIPYLIMYAVIAIGYIILIVLLYIIGGISK